MIDKLTDRDINLGEKKRKKGKRRIELIIGIVDRRKVEADRGLASIKGIVERRFCLGARQVSRKTRQGGMMSFGNGTSIFFFFSLLRKTRMLKIDVLAFKLSSSGGTILWTIDASSISILEDCSILMCKYNFLNCAKCERNSRNSLLVPNFRKKLTNRKGSIREEKRWGKKGGEKVRRWTRRYPTSDKSGITDRVSRCRVGGGINSGCNRAVPVAGINNFVRLCTDGRGRMNENGGISLTHPEFRSETSYESAEG